MKNRGEKNGRAKLDWEKVLKIRRIYSRRKQPYWNFIRNTGSKKCVSSFTLSYDFNMAQSTIHNILTNKTWKTNDKENTG